MITSFFYIVCGHKSITCVWLYVKWLLDIMCLKEKEGGPRVIHSLLCLEYTAIIIAQQDCPANYA